MNASDSADPSDLRALRIDVLRQAVAIYLEHAYAGTEPPEMVLRRLEWADGVDAAQLLTSSPFEKVSPAGALRPEIYALRLGNARYPHMKLQVQPWPTPAGFLLSVNTHDQVLAPPPDSPDAEPFRVLQADNQQIKERIELAWDQAGLPTFLRYLRDYIQKQPATDENDSEASSSK
ncbi:hypothetical protein BH23PLA1_BH23PLA1_11190 [soil metagenome]